MKRATVQRGIVILASLTVSIIAAEILLRLVGFRINSVKDTANQPIFGKNATYTNVGVAGRVNEYKILVTNNSLGYNDREHQKEKPANTVRVLVIGDSFVNGNHVEKDQNLTAQLEKLLNSTSKGKPYEVVNMGAHGAEPAQYWWMLLNTGLQFHPDIVLIEFLPENDVADSTGTIPEAKKAWQKAIVSHQLLSQAPFDVLFASRLASLMLFTIDQYLPKLFLLTLPKDEQINPDWFSYCRKAPNLTRWETAWTNLTYSYQQMKKVTEENRADFYLVTFTSDVEIDAYNGKNTLPKELVPYDCNARYPNDRIDAFAKKNGFNYLNLNPLFAKREKETGVNAHYRFDRHWNKIGHQWAAEEIMKAFGEKFLAREAK